MDLLGLIQNTDDKILDLIQLGSKNPFFDRLMPLLSFLGNLGMIWLALALVFIIFKRHRRLGINLLLTLLLGTLIGNTLIKPLVGRVRPCNVNMLFELLIARPDDFSFPSGHTMASFGAAVTIFCYNKRFGVWAFILAALIAFSRLYLYVHYPSDVLAGAVLGALMAGIAIFVVKSAEKIIQKRRNE